MERKILSKRIECGHEAIFSGLCFLYLFLQEIEAESVKNKESFESVWKTMEK